MDSYDVFVDCLAIFPEVAIGDIDEKIDFIPTTSNSRFTDLQQNRFDVLIRVSTFTLTRDRNSNNGPNLHFCPPYFRDGQGLMASSIWSLADLNGKKVAVSEDTDSQYYLDKFTLDQGYTYTKVTYSSPTNPQMYSDYEAGIVNAVSADKSILLHFMSGLTTSGNHQIFDVSFSKEPLSPVVRYGDDQWVDIVSWVVYALIEAEELGLTSLNIDAPPNIERETFSFSTSD
jgi:general L-amino acid transport system substrate-binding protein